MWKLFSLEISNPPRRHGDTENGGGGGFFCRGQGIAEIADIARDRRDRESRSLPRMNGDEGGFVSGASRVGS